MTNGRTRVKVCGIRTREAARAAAEAGADALGFNFHPKSVRHVEPEDAWEIMADLPPFITTVGVFVDAKLDAFVAVEEACPTALSQLHGSESVDLVCDCGPDVIKAVRFDPETIAGEIARWQGVDEVMAILVDGSAGGAGTSFDWEALAPHAEAMTKPLILAGGLSPANVGEAIRALRPWAVDVASGVESAPGVKDETLIREFCAAVRESDAAS